MKPVAGLVPLLGWGRWGLLLQFIQELDPELPFNTLLESQESQRTRPDGQIVG